MYKIKYYSELKQGVHKAVKINQTKFGINTANKDLNKHVVSHDTKAFTHMTEQKEAFQYNIK